MADTITAGAMQALSLRRRERWAQTPQTRTPTPEAAIPLIERLGVVTLYPLSPELPDLLHAYVGNDTERAVLPSWDSPMGDVYTWRWTLGRQSAAFYSAFLRGRPTWVSWALLPAVLRLRGELRTPDELYDARVISADAYRIAHVLDEASEPLPTGELRQRAARRVSARHRRIGDAVTAGKSVSGGWRRRKHAPCAGSQSLSPAHTAGGAVDTRGSF